MKKIDTSYSVFEDLILNNNLYVDKTSYLYKLITQGKRDTIFFLDLDALGRA